jgi:predicted O-methyltransferase YrrM
VRTHRGAILACCGSECSGAQRIVFEQSITPSIFVEMMAAMGELDHMNDRSILYRPRALEAILRETADLGFSMASELQTGSLLQTLAASKPAGRFLELGTGTGVATAWLLAGMDKASRLESVDNDPTVVAIARKYLGSDPRVTFHVDEGAAFIERQTPGLYDFVFADAWPGKFSHLEQALALVRVGGLYFVDDLLPRPNWPTGHAPIVSALIEGLATHDGFVATKLAWASGLMVVVRTR